MFDFIKTFPDDDAIEIIKKHHDALRDLFDRFKKTENLSEQKAIVAKALTELKIHTIAEEQVFYPAIRDKLDKHMMTEADEEHHESKLLTSEIEQMDGSEDHWWAKFHVLTENVTHHLEEEEEKMLPKARKLEVDFTLVGKQMLARKQQLLQNGIPVQAEEKLIKENGIADSSAKAAKLKKEY